MTCLNADLCICVASIMPTLKSPVLYLSVYLHIHLRTCVRFYHMHETYVYHLSCGWFVTYLLTYICIPLCK